MSRYLPAGSAVMSPVLAASDAHTYERERDMLLGMIMRMQADIRQLQERADAAGGDDVRRHRHTPADTGYVEMPPQLPVKLEDVNPMEINTSDSTPSLDDTERAAIVNALERNLGRRKAAAAELGISERTLYRKIKEYGLE